MKQQAVVVLVDIHEHRVETVELPEGHVWDSALPSSKWGHFQTCRKCGTKISWSKNEAAWFVSPSDNEKIPSCQEIIMNEALE